jgi:hypothetical protein
VWGNLSVGANIRRHAVDDEMSHAPMFAWATIFPDRNINADPYSLRRRMAACIARSERARPGSAASSAAVEVFNACRATSASRTGATQALVSV